MKCDLCPNDAEYRRTIEVWAPYTRKWQTVLNVHEYHYYCTWHFFLLEEHTREWVEAQHVRAAQADAEEVPF